MPLFQSDPRLLSASGEPVVGYPCAYHILAHATIYKHFRTDDTGLMCAVNFRICKGNTVNRSLNDDILFGVQASAYFMPLAGRNSELFPKTPDFEAMRDARGSPVIARSQNMLVLDSDGADTSPQTSRAFRDQMRNVHEIIGPGDTRHRFSFRSLGKLSPRAGGLFPPARGLFEPRLPGKQRELTCKSAHFRADFLKPGFIAGAGNGIIDPCCNTPEIFFLQTAGRQGRRAEADTRSYEGRTSFKRNGILVGRNARRIQSVLGILAGDVFA